MAKGIKTDWSISIYNRRIDKTKTVQHIGANGIHYKYIMPIFGDVSKFHEQAIDVQSIKSPNSKYKNGKRPGQYQPVGDKRYFTFYQLNKMTPEEVVAFYERIKVVVE